MQLTKTIVHCYPKKTLMTRLSLSRCNALFRCKLRCKRFLDHNTRYSKLSVRSKQSSKLSQSSQHTPHKTKLSSKPSRSTHSSSSTSSSVKSSLEKERALLLATQAKEMYNQKLKQIEKEQRTYIPTHKVPKTGGL